MNSSTMESNSSIDGLGYTLGPCLGIIVLFVVVTCISYTCKRVRDEISTTRNHPSSDSVRVDTDHDGHDYAIRQNGLDESTLSSFPQITYSAAKAGDSAGCSICLSDYGHGDLLRLLPDCGHHFHLACVDPWLLLHSSCPVCRFSPSPPPPLAPPGS